MNRSLQVGILFSNALVVAISAPTAGAEEPRVERPLYVYVIEGAPMAATADNHIAKAVEIWKAAGIVFVPKIEKIQGARVTALLGDDRKMQSFAGESDQEKEPGYTERRNLAKLKPSPKALAVFFVLSDWMSRADPNLFQVYVDGEPALTPVGRTMAHEIGHLLLGPGHTGKPGVPWTSGLMSAGGAVNDGVDISKEDGAMARARASQIPK